MSVDLFSHLPLILFAFLLAGTVKGVVGMGLPLVVMGLLGLVMTPMQAAALLVIPSLATNFWQVADGRSPIPMLRRLWPMLLATVAGTLGLGWLLHGRQMDAATPLLGLALLIYGAMGLASVRFHAAPQRESWLAPLIGLATGMITAVTGIFTLPAVPYLQAIGLEKDDLVQGLGLSFSVSTLALAVLLGHNGQLLDAHLLGSSALALLPALLGMAAGQWLRRRISTAQFRLCFFVGLVILGVNLMWQAT